MANDILTDLGPYLFSIMGIDIATYRLRIGIYAQRAPRRASGTRSSCFPFCVRACAAILVLAVTIGLLSGHILVTLSTSGCIGNLTNSLYHGCSHWQTLALESCATSQAEHLHVDSLMLLKCGDVEQNPRLRMENRRATGRSYLYGSAPPKDSDPGRELHGSDALVLSQ